MDLSEQEFEARVNEKEEYADAVAQQGFESAAAMGMPYEAAIAEGQKAQDDAERHYEEVTKKKQVYADAIAKQQYESALAMGASYEQALAMGHSVEQAKRMAQRALDDAEKEFD